MGKKTYMPSQPTVVTTNTLGSEDRERIHRDLSEDDKKREMGSKAVMNKKARAGMMERLERDRQASDEKRQSMLAARDAGDAAEYDRIAAGTPKHRVDSSFSPMQEIPRDRFLRMQQRPEPQQRPQMRLVRGPDGMLMAERDMQQILKRKLQFEEEEPDFITGVLDYVRD